MPLASDEYDELVRDTERAEAELDAIAGGARPGVELLYVVAQCGLAIAGRLELLADTVAEHAASRP